MAGSERGCAVDDDDEDVMAQHRHRPDWRCRDCLDPWPCRFFRRRLLAVADGKPQNLRTYMEQYRRLAGAELVDATPEELDERFLGWLTRPPARRLRLRSIG